MPDEFVNVRYMVDDVERAVDFYTTHFGFEVRSSHPPAFADVVRGKPAARRQSGDELAGGNRRGEAHGHEPKDVTATQTDPSPTASVSRGSAG